MKFQKCTLFSGFLLPALFLLATISVFANKEISQSNLLQDNSSRFTHTISGTVNRLPGDVPFEGVEVVFSGVGTALVDSAGFYTMQAPRNWSGTATPQFGDGGFYDFTPAQYSYTDLKFDQFDQNFTGEANTAFSISGQFTEQDSGDPFANKTITFKSLTPASPDLQVTTDDLGFYSIDNLLPSYHYEFEPDYDDYYYITPFTRDYSPLASDMTAQDYTYINYAYPIPAGWQYNNTGLFHIISIEKTSMPDICSTDLQIGDLIGVFYYDFNNNLKCGGWIRWQDKINMGLIAQGDDTQTTPGIKDGFATGETMIWRVYSYEQQQAFPAQPDYKTESGLLSNNKWQSMGLSIIQGVNGQIQETLTIPPGWSGISGYLAPQPNAMATVMAPISDELVILQNLQGVFYPEGGINNIGNWAYNKGYVIKLNDEAALPLTGCPSANKTIGLATGWNIVPVISNCDVAIDDLFAPVMNKITIIKEVAGTGIYWPAMGIQTLEVFNPGKAYYVAASQNATITYQSCDETKNLVFNKYQETENLTLWGSPTKTPSTHIIALGEDILKIAGKGDFIGAFYGDDICAGLVQIQDTKTNHAITIFGNDGSTDEQDGFVEGESMNLKLFKTQTGEVFELEVEYDQSMPSWNGKFQNNGLSAIKTMKIAATGIDQNTRQRVMIYPNPANASVTFSAKDNSAFVLSLQNTNGRILLEEKVSGSRSFDLSHFSRGIYIVKIENGDATTYEKLVLN
jgi:hypothetical protein